MKLVFKIVMVAIVMIIIPVIIITVFRRLSSSESNYLSARDQLSEVVTSERIVLDGTFSEYISDVRILAGHKNVLGLVQYANGHKGGKNEDSDDYPRVSYQADMYMRMGGIYAIEITDNSEKVIFSTDDSAKNKASDFDNIEGKTYYNGISSLFMYKDIPMFCIEKDIINEKNESLGRLRFVYNAEIIANTVDSLEISEFNKIVIVDNSSNIFESPYKSVKKLEWNTEYKAFSDFINTYLSHTDNSGFSDFYDYKYQGKEKSVCITSAVISGWSVIGVVNLFDYDMNYFKNFNFIWIIVIFEIVITIIVMNHILSPVSKILGFLYKRRKGDNSASLEYTENDELGTVSYLLTSVIDHLSASEEKYRAIAEMTDNIVFDVNLEKNIVTVSSNFNKKFSFRPKDDSLTESFLFKCHVFKDDRSNYLSDLNKLFVSNETNWDGEYRLKTMYGDFSWIRIRAKKLLNRKDIPTRIVGIMSDIDRQKESELNLIQKASLDALTQLYNRETFIKMLKAESDKGTGKSTLTAIMFIDLDDFKFFNDQYGHNCGDEVLKFAASAIKEACFERGFGGRFGGDEFIICFTGLKLIGNAGEIASGIIKTLSEGFDSEADGDLHLSVKCSIGIAFMGENGRTPEELIAAADSAMYKIKKHGKSDFAYASADEKSERDLESATSVIDSDVTE